MYSTEEEWLLAENKKVVLFGMSGLGKTHISNILRQSGEWYHYSIDYRIGTPNQMVGLEHDTAFGPYPCRSQVK